MFQRIVEFEAAFDKRDPDPNKDYGIHGVTLRMVLKGPLGAIQFVVYTNWHLPHIDRSGWPQHMCDPMPADLGYHSPHAMYEGQTQTDNCPWLDGKPCFYDGSGLQADPIFALLVEKGGEAVWKELERRYRGLFGDAE